MENNERKNRYQRGYRGYPLMSPTATKNNVTPLMGQYNDMKEQYPNEILLFRLGDFYEIFWEDAKVAAPILEITLTQRQGNAHVRSPTPFLKPLYRQAPQAKPPRCRS